MYAITFSAALVRNIDQLVKLQNVFLLSFRLGLTRQERRGHSGTTSGQITLSKLLKMQIMQLIFGKKSIHLQIIRKKVNRIK